MASIESQKSIKVGFKREVQSELYPIQIVEALDGILARLGYRRLDSSPQDEEFVWTNDAGDEFNVDYYTKVNSIGHSHELQSDQEVGSTDFQKEVENLYFSLNTALVALFAQLSLEAEDPQGGVTRQLTLEVRGENSGERASVLIPVVRDLYAREEKLTRAEVDVLDEAENFIAIL